ncbi:hypothetical protein AB0368_06975 [Actinoplanes sp. NPDC051475]|uniref:preATP grasp domain-containing protein n=1 Tax=Actinoplanes sp. NPDC051475 TaxID=3157225 RepID=UPI00344FAD7C
MGIPHDPPFMKRVRDTVADGRQVVLMGNFEVEDAWAAGELGLPRLPFASATTIVNRMDELALLLAGPGDAVVLKSRPDSAYLAHLSELGFELPEILVPGSQRPERTVTEDALRDAALLDRLGRLGRQGSRLLPHGTSAREQGLAELAGIALATPDSTVCKAVNSKVYSRRLAERTGLRQPTGWACTTVTELRAAAGDAGALIDAGRSVVAKDAFGVSGKGIAVIRDRSRLDRLVRKIETLAAKRGSDNLGIVLEEWITKDADFNYQFTVGRDGSVHFDFVKRALTQGGVHKGHVMPSGLNAEQHDELTRAAEVIGGALAADGWFGIVGVDAMTTPAGAVHPVVEINARNNMSTYLASVQDRLLAGARVALAREYPLKLDRPVSYGELRHLLGELWWRPGGEGLLVNGFATVNAAASGDAPFDGRLYGVVVAPDEDTMHSLDGRIDGRLHALTREVTA